MKFSGTGLASFTLLNSSDHLTGAKRTDYTDVIDALEMDRTRAHAERGVPIDRDLWGGALDDKNKLACSCFSRSPH